MIWPSVDFRARTVFVASAKVRRIQETNGRCLMNVPHRHRPVRLMPMRGTK